MDIVLAVDNVLIVGMVASKFGKNQRKKIKNWGIAVAVLTRVIFIFIIALIVFVYYVSIAPILLQVNGLTLIFAFFLYYIAYTIYRDVIKPFHIRKKQKIKTKKFSFFKGMMIVLIADLGMSIKNVSVIVTAAREQYILLFFGLFLSILLMATTATFIPIWIKKHQWIGWLGILMILLTATDYVYDITILFL